MGRFRRGFLAERINQMFMVGGGERQRGKAVSRPGYSEKAQCTGMPSYLEPISQSMHRTIEEGVCPKKIEDRSHIDAFRSQWHVEKPRQAYLQPISGPMQKPIEGLLAQYRGALNKGAIEKNRTTVLPLLNQR
jgi:hypothetical protein